MTDRWGKELGRALRATYKEIGRDGVRQLEWAVRFTREQPTNGAQSERLRRQATVFAAPFHPRRPTQLGGLDAGPDGLNTVSAADVTAIQRRFAELLEAWTQRGRIDLPLREARVTVLSLTPQKNQGRQGRRRPVLWLAPADTDDDVSAAVYRLVQLLGLEGHRLRGCAAPKAGAEAGERCGTWFVGRPDQVHCSQRCRTRAGVREKRLRDALSCG
jgi:hypothetical protein